MSLQPKPPTHPVLERLSGQQPVTFIAPVKRINNGDDLTFFLSSTAYRDLMTWLHQLNRCMFPVKDSAGNVEENNLDSPPPYSDIVLQLREMVLGLRNTIAEVPPHTGPRRFGNVAFRTWYKLVEERVDGLLEAHVGNVLDSWSNENAVTRIALKEELKVYLLGAFGSAQRLDYGTGHELSFLAFLGGLWKLDAFEDGEERAIIVGVVQPYLELIRALILTYTLEPAGSHGVWGLDDHSFVPYIFGSAQLGPAVDPKIPEPVPTEGSLTTAPAPNSVVDKTIVAKFRDSNMYFSAIQFIYDVKKGPFWEHSPVLFDVSGIRDGWGKINKGMMKMYAAEVLGKFPVVQHCPFGRLFAWERDPLAGVNEQQASVYARQRPRSMDVPPPPNTSAAKQTTNPGTIAPWAGIAPSTATGIQSTRAPGMATAPLRPSNVSSTVTGAPWSRTPGSEAAANAALRAARGGH